MDDDDLKKFIDKAISDRFPSVAGTEGARPMVEKMVAEVAATAVEKWGKYSVTRHLDELAQAIASSPAFEKVGSTVSGILLKSVKISKDEMMDQITDLFSGDANTGDIKKHAERLWGKYAGAMKNISSAIGLDIDFEKIAKDPMAALKTAFDTTDVSGLLEGSIGQYAFSGLANSAKEADEKINSVIGNVSEYIKNAAEIEKVKINPFSELGKQTLDPSRITRDFEEEFTDTSLGLQLALNIDRNSANRAISEVYAGLTNYSEQMAGVKIQTDFGEPIEGVNALVVAAKALGMSVSDVTQKADEMGAKFGVNSTDIIARFEMMAKAGAKAGLAPGLLVETIMNSASAFADLGDATEESAAMLERFLDPKNPARMKMQIEAFKTASQGIAQMTDNLKAFVGMGSEIAGGGGAIEAIMRLDAAIQSGDQDALQEIFDQAISRIETITGAPMMTLQEAVDTGQEQVAYQQMQMLQDMKLAGSRGQASELVEAYRRGGIGVEGLRAMGGGPGLMETAVQKEGAGRGFFERLKTMAETGRDISSAKAYFKTDVLGSSLFERGNETAGGISDIGRMLYGKGNIIDELSSEELTAFIQERMSKKKLERLEREPVPTNIDAERLEQAASRAMIRAPAEAQTTSASKRTRGNAENLNQAYAADVRTEAGSYALESSTDSRAAAALMATNASNEARNAATEALIKVTETQSNTLDMLAQSIDKNAESAQKASNDIVRAAERIGVAASIFEKMAASGVEIKLSNEARKLLEIEKTIRQIASEEAKATATGESRR